jgi:hypothetical protein
MFPAKFASGVLVLANVISVNKPELRDNQNLAPIPVEGHGRDICGCTPAGAMAVRSGVIGIQCNQERAQSWAYCPSIYVLW